jgi:hypothetical protein
MGFSFAGFIIAAAVFAPNLLFIFFPPGNVPEGLKDKGAFFTVLERLGQAGCIVLLLISRDSFSSLSVNLWFLLMAFCIVAYYCLWIRYIALGRGFYLLFKPHAMIPVPMAVFPVLAFAFAAVLGRSVWLGIAVILLAIGHIANSLHTYKLVKKTEPEK